jgi:hypothetical protein
MRSILAAIAVLLCVSVSAAEIPSAASGAYVAPDRLCRVVLSRAGSNHVDVDLLCVTDAGMPTYSVTRAFAFGGACIGSPYVASVFSLSGPNPDAGFVALDAFTGAALQVRRSADVNVLVNGGGIAETWAMVRPIASPYPYTCGQQAQLRFRVFGR